MICFSTLYCKQEVGSMQDPTLIFVKNSKKHLIFGSKISNIYTRDPSSNARKDFIRDGLAPLSYCRHIYATSSKKDNFIA